MQNTNTRIDNLLSLTNLSQRKIDTKKNIDNLLSMPLDYVDVDERLEILRKSSLAYLEQALKRNRIMIVITDKGHVFVVVWGM